MTLNNYKIGTNIRKAMRSLIKLSKIPSTLLISSTFSRFSKSYNKMNSIMMSIKNSSVTSMLLSKRSQTPCCFLWPGSG